MKTININNGDSMAGAAIGDVIVNGYGEHVHIVGENGRVWLVESASGRVFPVFKAAGRIISEIKVG